MKTLKNRRIIRNLSWVLFLLLFSVQYTYAQMPPSIKESAKEPVKYIGTRQPDKHFYDGRLPHAVGAHHYQVFRANRAHPPECGESELVGWTYNHQPYLAYWNGKFYYQYLSNLVEEHGAPGRTLLMMSDDGILWCPCHIRPVGEHAGAEWELASLFKSSISR